MPQTENPPHAFCHTNHPSQMAFSPAKMKRFCLVIVLILTGCLSRNQAGQPRLGEKVDIGGPKKMLMIASAQLSPFTEVTRKGLTYSIAVNKSGKVIYVDCAEKAFRTPEELGIGASLAQVLAAGGSTVMEEQGWGYFSRLPSGWCAFFPCIKFDGKDVIELPPPNESTPVQLYFKRR